VNAVERTLAAIQNEACDRVPVIPLIIQHSLEVSGIPHSRYSSDPEAMASAQIAAWEAYGYDGFHITSDNYVVSEALGNRVLLPYDDPPQKVFTCLAETKDLSALRRDFDPLTDARMPVLIEATRIARERAGGRAFLKANCDSGPFSVASSLRGAENLFYDMYDDERFVFDLMEITAEAIVRYAGALAAAGADAITYGESTGSLVSRGMFEKFILPLNARVVGEIKKTGLPVFYHMCGKVDHVVDLMAKTGADVLELDSFTDLGAAYEKTNGKICIEGTVDTVSTLLRGTSRMVYDESRRVIDTARGRGLILSSGCELPRKTPPENVRAMLRAAEDAAGR
jgi:uroporphyrinogen decarboxylase